jgi:hypothetical protein
VTPEPKLRRELELVAWALQRYGSANDAEDHHAGGWAVDARVEAGDTIKRVLARAPRVDELVPGLAKDVASGAIEGFSWGDHLTAVRKLVKALVRAELDALAPLAGRTEWTGPRKARLKIDLTARSVELGSFASISQVARGRFHENIAETFGAAALVEIAEIAERVFAWQVAHGDAPARSGALPGDLVTEFRGTDTLYLGDDIASLDGSARLDEFLAGALHDEVRAKLGADVLARALESARLLRGDVTPCVPEPPPVRPVRVRRRADATLAVGGRLAVLHDAGSGELLRATLDDLESGPFAERVRAALGELEPR